MTGLIANHARKETDTVTPNDALEFLKLAAHEGRRSDQKAFQAAIKELALLYLEIEEDDQFLEHLMYSDPGALEDLAAGPTRSWSLLFADLAHAKTLAHGGLSRFFSHMDAREADFSAGAVDQPTRAFYDQIIKMLSEIFFRELTDRLVRMSKQGKSVEAGALVSSLEKILDEQDRTIMTRAYLMWCKPHLPRKVQLSMSLQHNQNLFPWLTFAPWALLLLLVGYQVWVIRSHQKAAKRLFRSGYSEDLERT